ncbi:acyl-CoA dehydrogenase family protein [Aureliella helgolandensis]|uniref:Dibenzothiophene desulfurization enzyme C n=1 Tax=Aureliella helgolandensis TaxID=2527968 RepID=A0A518G6V5_9BACT|nr:acyl-CoA dehydrogenase family protein [Aureliella helgolandensis]QDV24322.1 Dibenzothiophene desulfurization enzyme C [Aureliella helgolandensis]
MRKLEEQIQLLPSPVQQLCERLASAAGSLDQSAQWPAEQLQWCGEAGVFRWFVPTEFGGEGWSEEDLLTGYLALSQSCLTTTFVLTQWHAACRRIISSPNIQLRRQLLPQLADGSLFATVGISHLTTSRQHVARPVLTATPTQDGAYLLNGFSPWVTSASTAGLLVVGATLEDNTQMICAIPSDRDGLTTHPGEKLVALSSSCTDRVDLKEVRIESDEIVAGPIANVMQANTGGGAGGLQTSTLALGLTVAAVQSIYQQSEQRPELSSIAKKMAKDSSQLLDALRLLTLGAPCQMSAGELRQQANSLVLRSTQAALSAAKGAGFLASHPTGRWAREALFFLVWSCPQPVAAANMCELAQLCD